MENWARDAANHQFIPENGGGERLVKRRMPRPENWAMLDSNCKEGAMAVDFRSAQRRAFWGGIGFSLVAEYLVALSVYVVAANGSGYAWVWALLTVIGIQLFLTLYALLSFGRRAIWYHLFEREVRAASILREFDRLNFPRPDGTYIDGDQYLREVALSPATSPEGALFAGTLLGALEGHRLNGPRSEAFFLALSIERALKLMLPWEAAAERRTPQ